MEYKNAQEALRDPKWQQIFLREKGNITLSFVNRSTGSTKNTVASPQKKG
jgi:hypothetical protein